MEQTGFDFGQAAPEREPMVGVSTVAKAVIGSGQLLGWAHSQGRRGLPLHNQEALDRGNASHRVLEALLAGAAPIPRDTKPEWRGYLEGIVARVRGDGWKLLAVETSLSLRHQRINGRIDYVRACPGCRVCRREFLAEGDTLPGEALEHPDLPGVVLGDVKTGGLKVRRESHLQVGGGYRRLWESTPLGGRPVRAMCCGAEVLAVDERGDSRVVAAALGPAHFDRALAWYRDLVTCPDDFA